MALSELFFVEVALLIVVPVVAGIFLSKWIGDAAKRRGSSPLLVRTLRLLVTVIWISIVLVGSYLAFGPFSFLSALTVSAVVSIALVLALQTALQNIISGFTLLRQGFLRLGDVVQISGVKGSVVSIGLLNVVLKLEDGSLAVVSNATLLSGPYINHSTATRLAGEY